MDMTVSKDVTARIAKLVQKLIDKRTPGKGPIAPSQDLAAAGLTSLDMVNLMLAVEEEFEVFVPQKRMTPDNFRTIFAIDALLSDILPHA